MGYTFYATPATPITSPPSGHGLAGWTFDPIHGQAGTILGTAGLAYVARIRVLTPTVSAINFVVTAGGASLTSGQCFASLHNDAGAILGAGAVTGSLHGTGTGGWGDAGFKTCALSVAQGVTANAFYRVLLWANTASTLPTFLRAGNVSAAATNPGMSAPTFRFSTADTGLTTTAPSNIATQTGSPIAMWVGVTA